LHAPQQGKATERGKLLLLVKQQVWDLGGWAGGVVQNTDNLCEECRKPTKGGKKTERCECEQYEECSAK